MQNVWNGVGSTLIHVIFIMACALAVMKCVQRANVAALRSITINCISYTKHNPRRNIQSASSKPHKTDTTWVPVYSFPYIAVAAALNRFKLYQTAFTVIVIPASIAMNYYGIADMTLIKLTAGAGIFACTTLYIFTSFFKKLVGIIYVTDDKKMVKIAHLTFWGDRKDIIIPTEDIVPLTDYECKVTDIYVKLRRYSTEEFLYLTLRFGKIKDKDKFESVFGQISLLK